MTLVLAGALDPAGPIAREIAGLWWLMLGLGIAVFLVFAAALVAALTRPRGSTASIPSEGGSKSAKRLIVAGGVVMPVIVLIAIFGATIEVMRGIPATADRSALVIEVVGHQWWWEVRYPEYGITTENEIHLPVGRPVELRLTSADVIHSLWVPQLAGKLDLLPEDTNTLVVEADEPGRYRGVCAEFCGLLHAKMEFVTIAKSPEEFASWLATQQQLAAEPSSGNSLRRDRVTELERLQ